MRHAMCRALRLAMPSAIALLVTACSSTTGQPVVPRVLSAHVSQVPADPNFRHFLSNSDHRLILQTVGGDTAMRIVGKEFTGPGAPVPAQLVDLQITVFGGVTLGPAVYRAPQGEGQIDVVGLNGTWRSQHTTDFTLDVTQLDLAANQASGTFRFVGKRSPNDTESLFVEEGAFLFLAIDDQR